MEARKILIVDDEPFIIEALRFALEQSDYLCRTARDGVEAIKLIGDEKPDLVLLDVMLPRMGGHKVCRLIKSDERWRDIPVIMMTARTQESDRTMAQDSGAEEYVTKPFDMDSLIALVDSYLKGADRPAPEG